MGLSVANEQVSRPVAYRPYLPKGWAEGPDRRAKAGVPAEIRFRTKPQIALGQIGEALARGIPPCVVLAALRGAGRRRLRGGYGLPSGAA